MWYTLIYYLLPPCTCQLPSLSPFLALGHKILLSTSIPIHSAIMLPFHHYTSLSKCLHISHLTSTNRIYMTYPIHSFSPIYCLTIHHYLGGLHPGVHNVLAPYICQLPSLSLPQFFLDLDPRSQDPVLPHIPIHSTIMHTFNSTTLSLSQGVLTS